MEEENVEQKQEIEENPRDFSSLTEAPARAPEVPKKSSKKPVILVITVLLLIIFGILGFKFFKSKKAVKPENPVPSATQIPTPTPQSVLNRADWSFEVLNGSGAAGLAKKIADKLKDLGYPVIKTGNADRDDYPKTAIFVKSSLKDKLDLVIADIKDVIKIASVAGELKEGTASARIIIGKDQ